MDRRAIDTNVLVYAHLPAMPEHARVRAFLTQQLASTDVVLVLTPMVLHELTHVITDPRRFNPPLEMSEALPLVRLYLERSNVECLEVDAKAMLLATDLIERHRLGRKRIADTLFAATLLNHGVHELITCNGSDFSVFEKFTLIDPRTA